MKIADIQRVRHTWKHVKIMISRHRKGCDTGIAETPNPLLKRADCLKKSILPADDISGEHDQVDRLGDRKIHGARPDIRPRKPMLIRVHPTRIAPQMQITGT